MPNCSAKTESFEQVFSIHCENQGCRPNAFQRTSKEFAERRGCICAGSGWGQKIDDVEVQKNLDELTDARIIKRINGAQGSNGHLQTPQLNLLTGLLNGVAFDQHATPLNHAVLAQQH